MKKTLLASSITLIMAASFSANAAQQYADFPVTVKGYEGYAKVSVSYKGQAARQVLQSSLKKLISKGDGADAEAIKKALMAYYQQKDAGREILSPASKDSFPVSPAMVDELSKKKNLAGKVFGGVVSGWPGNMNGTEVLDFMLTKAAATKGGYDPLTGYDYKQLVSKFAMGAVFYNQAVDNYLDEKLAADVKPNDKPYKAGAAYTGKEHVWDEAFGYFGAPANTLNLTAEQVYQIGKQKKEVFEAADTNKDGTVSLYNEMAYGHAVYAASFDKGGKTNYLHTIVQAFVDGRQLITDAGGEALTDEQRTKLEGYAKVIAENWQKVIAEAVFKYAGETYKDLRKLEKLTAANGDVTKAFRDYVKHWGEMKGFALALQTGPKNLGEVAVKLNKLTGFGPVLLGNTQVTGIDADGNYQQVSSVSMDEYMLHMVKIQKLMLDNFKVTARKHDVLEDMSTLAEKLGSGGSAEND